MWVKAIKGGKVPIPGKSGQSITDSQAKDVPNASWVRRLLREGSLGKSSKPAVAKGSKLPRASKPKDE